MIALEMCSHERILDREHIVNNREKTVIKRDETLKNARFSNTSFDTSILYEIGKIVMSVVCVHRWNTVGREAIYYSVLNMYNVMVGKPFIIPCPIRVKHVQCHGREAIYYSVPNTC
jgi:hypothetical protein